MSDKKKRNISSEEREKRRLYMIHYHETHKEDVVSPNCDVVKKNKNCVFFDLILVPRMYNKRR